VAITPHIAARTQPHGRLEAISASRTAHEAAERHGTYLARFDDVRIAHHEPPERNLMTSHRNPWSALTMSGILLAALASGCATKRQQDPEAISPSEGAADATLAEPRVAEHERSMAGVTDEEVEAFARAYIAVLSLEERYKSELSAVSSPEEARSIQAEAQQEMQNAIEGEGISVAEFEQIGTKASDDEALRMRIQEQLDDLQPPAEAP
jgi:hypothetical protein